MNSDDPKQVHMSWGDRAKQVNLSIVLRRVPDYNSAAQEPKTLSLRVQVPNNHIYSPKN